MKKSIVFFGSLLCLLFLTACIPTTPPEPKILYSRSFVQGYLEVGRIEIVRLRDKKLDYSLDFKGKDYYGIENEGLSREKYDALCEKYGDITYNRNVYFSPIVSKNTRCASAFIRLAIISNAAWDENHPLGRDLGDIVRFESNTPLPYIRSGYTKKYAETQDGEYYPVDRLVSELTQDDMTLLPASFLYCPCDFRFTHAPTLARQHTLTFTLTDDEGVEYSASVDVDFDALDPK